MKEIKPTRREKQAYETMSKMEEKISQLKTDLENAVRRGDELFDQLEELKKDNESLIEFKLVQIDQLMEEISKKDEIIKELEESNEFYADTDSWMNDYPHLIHSDDQEDLIIDGDLVEYVGGKLAREKKSKVEELRNQ